MGNYDYTKIKTGDYNYDYTKFGKADYDYNNHCNRLQMITITIVISPMPDVSVELTVVEPYWSAATVGKWRRLRYAWRWILVRTKHVLTPVLDLMSSSKTLPGYSMVHRQWFLVIPARLPSVTLIIWTYISSLR